MKNTIIIFLAVIIIVLLVAIKGLYQTSEQWFSDARVYKEYMKACEAQLSLYE